MTRRQTLIAVVAVLQTAALAAMVAMKQYTLTTGVPVLLETQPIDPRSLFRGDYVRLNYAIGALRRDDFPETDLFARNDTIHVRLRKRERYWEPVSIHAEAPAAQPGDVVIRGRVRGGGAGNRVWDPAGGGSFNGLQVRYGIENYFVPEGEGRALERPGDGVVSILVAVDRWGNAGIKGVLVDGELRYEERLF